MALAYIQYVNQNRAAFEAKVKKIAANLGISADWLMIVMYVESRLNHLAQSGASSAVGLIQFIASTRATLGVTATQLLSMSNVQQLDYVEKYLLPYKGKMSSIYDVYFAVFSPAAIGKSNATVLYSSGSNGYEANKPLDTDKNGTITVGNVKSWFDKYIPATIEKGNIFNSSAVWVAVVAAFVIIKKRKSIIKIFS